MECRSTNHLYEPARFLDGGFDPHLICSAGLLQIHSALGIRLLADRDISGAACAISWQRSEFTSGGRTMLPIVRAVPFLVSVMGIASFAMPVMAQTDPKPPATYRDLPSEIPDKFTPKDESFDYSRRTAMIPMRDGVKLHTVVLVPKGAKGA